jgi:hypothetical protein
MNHGESHPRDPEVAYKMRKIQITNKKKIGNCRLVRLSKNQQKPFRDSESACAR